MPIYDFACPNCDSVFEEYVHDYRIQNIPCRRCHGQAEKQFSFRSAYKEDAEWIKSVLDVVDKDSNKPHVRRFLETPNRKNWKSWMKGEGLRPLENNERIKPEPINMERIVKEVTNDLREWNKIEI